MKSLWLSLSLLVFSCSPRLQQTSFDYDQAWEQVYRLELQGLPNSASQKVDSIYTAATGDAAQAVQRVKAVIYQSKLLLLLEENAQEQVIAKLKAEIKNSPRPLSNILESVLARSYLAYYFKNRYRIAGRTSLDGPEADFAAWDKKTFLNNIKSHFMKSLDFDSAHLAIPTETYEEILTKSPGARKYRPWLIDLLAHEALTFLSIQDDERHRPADYFRLSDPGLFSSTGHFLTLDINAKDSSSFWLKAVDVYQWLTVLHERHGSVEARIQLELDRRAFVFKYTDLTQKDSLYLASLRQLKQKYDNEPASARIDFEMAKQLDDLGDQYSAQNKNSYQFHKAEARNLCLKSIKSFPGSFGSKQCEALVKKIEEPSMQIKTEKHLLPDTPAKILLTYKQHDQINFKTYRLSPAQLDSALKFEMGRSDTIPIADLEMAQEWTSMLKNEQDYQKHSTEVLFPPHGPGAYLLQANSATGKLLGFTTIQVTNLALVYDDNGSQRLFRVISRLNGAAIPNVKVHLKANRRNYSDSFVNQHFVTDEKGQFTFSNPEVYSKVKISLDNGLEKTVLYHGYLSAKHERRKAESKGDYYAHVQLFTDRSIYRPGQEIFFKGILIKQLSNSSQAVEGEVLFVSLVDPNNEVVSMESFETNEFGSVAGSFQLPASVLTGFYRLKVENNNPGSEFFNKAESFNGDWHGVSVEEYKRARFEIDFDPIEGVFLPNDSVWVSGTALAFTGGNLANARVKYLINRETDLYHPYYFSASSALLTEGEMLTDAQGNFKIPFRATFDPTVKRSESPVSRYQVLVEVTDANGETRAGNIWVKVAYRGLNIRLLVDETINLRKGKAVFTVEAKSLNGSSENVRGVLRVFRLQAPELVKRTQPWPAPDYPGFTKEEHYRLFPHFPYAVESLPLAWPREKQYFSEELKEGDQTVQIEDLSSWPPGKYLVEFVTEDNGVEVIKTEIFDLIDPDSDKVTGNQRFYIEADKATYVAGDTATIRYGTAASDMVVNIAIKKQDGIIERFSVRLKNEIKTLKIPITGKDEGGIGVFYDYTVYNTSEHGRVALKVLQQHPSLQITTGTFRNKLTPGEKEQWSFTIRGGEKDRVSAELLASMYDASLDQFMVNHWRLDAFRSKYYDPYHSFRTLSSFEIKQFSNATFTYNTPIPKLPMEKLNQFGMSVSYPDRSQKQYLTTLGWTDSTRLVVATFEKALESGLVIGQVINEFGLPAEGVRLSVIDKNQSVLTDSTGRFELKAASGQSITIQLAGYKTLTWPVDSRNYLEIRMLPAFTDFQQRLRLNNRNDILLLEIPDEEEFELAFDMVSDKDLAAGAMNYRASMTRSYDWGPANSDTQLISYYSTSGATFGLCIIDGVPGDILSLKPGDIFSSELLTPAQAMALYGDKGENGILIITTKKGFAAQNALLANVKTRTNLKETAFFFPQLKTNNKGEVSFQFDSPEALTRWNLQLLAHDKRLASGLLKRTVVTQKELMIVPNPPRFFRDGDTITFSTKLVSLSADEIKGVAKLELYDELTGKLLGSVITGTANQSFRLEPMGNTSLSWQLNIPEGVQAIRYKTVAASDDFSDGEENVLPVLSNRMLVQESVPLWARSNSTKTFSFDKLKSQQSASLRHHNLTLTMTINPVWEAIQSLPYLMEYPYECAEQTFARYYANRLGAYLVESFPVIKDTFDQWAASGTSLSRLEQNQELKALLIEETPWLREAKSQTEQQQRLAMLFEAARMQEQLQSSLDKLRKMQLGSGGFPWFSGSDRANLYITQHIIAGLAHLQKLTRGSEFQDIIDKGQSFMDRELIRHYESLTTRAGFREADKHIGFLQVQYLYTRSLTTTEEPSEALAEALGFFEKQAFNHWLQMDLQSQAMIALYAKRSGRNDDKAMQIIASLKEYSIVDDEKGIYWKNNVTGWYNWEAPIETQALLIEAFYEITDDQTYYDGMRQWLLAEKRTKSWKSTKATTEAIYALLRGEMGILSPNNNVTVTVGGEQVYKSDINEGGSDAGYFKKVWQPTEIKPEMGDVVVENAGNTAVFGGLHWQYFEDLDRITPAMGPLSLEKKIFLVNNSAAGEVLEAIGENTQLALGDLVRVRIVLKSDRSMEFIHLKDMRAAGFEPVNVLSGYRWQDGLSYYESTRDAATNFFIEYLPKGVFVFEYDLRVNNEGNFSNGITSIQNMYAPEFSSHSEGIRVVIGKDK